MKKTPLFLLLPLLFFAASSCSNSNQWLGEDEDVDNGILANAKYKISKIDYFMSEGDAVEIATYRIPDVFIYNRSDVIQEMIHDDSYTQQESSHFTYQIEDEDVLKKLDIDMIATPYEIYEEKIYSVKDDWMFNNDVQSRSIKHNLGQSSTKVSAQSAAKISFSYEVKVLTCSFKAIFINDITGEQKEVVGKWKGSIRHHSISTTVNDIPLPEK